MGTPHLGNLHMFHNNSVLIIRQRETLANLGKITVYKPSFKGRGHVKLSQFAQVYV